MTASTTLRPIFSDVYIFIMEFNVQYIEQTFSGESSRRLAVKKMEIQRERECFLNLCLRGQGTEGSRVTNETN